MWDYETFDDWSEAFAYCREGGHPIRVIIEGWLWKLYPSGRAEKIRLCPLAK